METLQLRSTPLEEAVQVLLSSFEAVVRPGPNGEHDLEITFPTPFVRQIDNEHVARIEVNKKIVVEVKSDLMGGAGLKHLRQLHDWVTRESRRIVTAEEEAWHLASLEAALLDVDYRLPKGDASGYSKGEAEDARTAVQALRDAVERAIMSVTYRTKGLLVINHHANVTESKRGRVIESNALPFARSNHLAVIAWDKLLKVADKVHANAFDPLNFWCHLFETDGVVESVDYDWRQECGFSYNLFEPNELTLISRAKFFRPEPETRLRVPQLWAADPTPAPDDWRRR
jgi:hypothetical protein